MLISALLIELKLPNFNFSMFLAFIKIALITLFSTSEVFIKVIYFIISQIIESNHLLTYLISNFYFIDKYENIFRIIFAFIF